MTDLFTQIDIAADNEVCQKLGGGMSANPMRSRKEKRVRLIQQYQHKTLDWLEDNIGLRKSTIMRHCADRWAKDQLNKERSDKRKAKKVVK